MTQQVFADYIGKSAATLSGIFNGRTRPTLDIVDAIKQKIPALNTDWLLFGSGEMYISGDAPSAGGQPAAALPREAMLDFGTPPPTTPLPQPQAPANYQSVRTTPLEPPKVEVKYLDKPARHVTEIRVYYDDQTWESFVPSKK